MAEWLSEEWLSGAAGLTELLPPVPGANGTVDLAISTAPRKEVHLNWRYAEGAPTGGATGPHPEADLSLTISSADAVPVLKGDIEPSVAFMRGRLKASGDGGLLLGFLDSTNDSAFASWRGRVQELGLPAA
jgi:hypothetical protein